MVRLQMRLQASKQLDQSGSENAAIVYHRLPNDTKKMTKSMVALHGATQAPEHKFRSWLDSVLVGTGAYKKN
jgi:hypothetical protein